MFMITLPVLTAASKGGSGGRRPFHERR
jgi:hypothetical protein